METKSKAKLANPAQPQYVTKDELENFGSNLIDALSARIDKIAPPAAVPAVADAKTQEEAKIANASPNKYTVNEEWDEEARKIIGEAVDHTEVVHERNGGIKFTVVIKKEMSNAPESYLQYVKIDRRTKEVGSEGISGVMDWCKLIKQNLSRPR